MKGELSLAARAALGVIRAYQVVLSPLFGGQCRFYPSCSTYGLDAYREWGAWRGTVLTVRRLARCHPLAKGGVDPVPLRRGRDGAVNSAVHTAPHAPARAPSDPEPPCCKPSPSASSSPRRPC